MLGSSILRRAPSCAVPHAPIFSTHTHTAMSVPHAVAPQAASSDGVMLSVVAMVLEQPTASGGGLGDGAPRWAPLWAATLSLLARPLQRLRYGSLHPLSVLADLPQFTTR